MKLFSSTQFFFKLQVSRSPSATMLHLIKGIFQHILLGQQFRDLWFETSGFETL